ncbi:LysR family transcriptional regulator [Algoriphagus aestuariicola]|uniref:LysR family transcriptional regulator n=1 Tax=Algoriphagus aestuariicola TaxID=1852016 RepID=A0ABS3BUS5_9BACT|nr:LysR family transcriptional regulator [Algoriphagus aestuariicola]MBN7802868.1 LysR family transcriptional regulator [Algoriphagus aestuariicola]
MIDYRYEVFLVVARHLSFSKAAEHLFISQPAVSKHIQQLEGELGAALFVRKGNMILLTPAGDQLLEELQPAVRIQKGIRTYFDALKKDEEIKGEIKIGASTTSSLYVIPKILAALHREIPGAQILLLNGNSETILKALDSQEIDMACVESFHHTNAYQSEPFMLDGIIPVCASSSPYAKDKLPFEELVHCRMALRERGSGTLATLSQAFEERGIKLFELNVIARLGGTEALKNYLIEAEAVGFLSRLAVQKELKSGVLKEINVPGFEVMREFSFVTRKGEERHGLMRKFIRKARTIYNEKL